MYSDLLNQHGSFYIILHQLQNSLSHIFAMINVLRRTKRLVFILYSLLFYVFLTVFWHLLDENKH